MHPCCGGSLQTGTKIVAVLHVVSSIVVVIFGISAFELGARSISLSESAQYQETAMNMERRQLAAAGAIGVAAGVLFGTVGIFNLFLAALLMSGANKRNRTRCMVWFVLNVIFLGCTVFKTTGAIFSGVSAALGGVTGFAVSIIGILIESYLLWVVWAFMTELKEGVSVAYSGNSAPRV